MSAHQSDRRYVAALILAAASWGFATAISKRAVDEIPPLILLPIQLAASAAVLAVALRLNGNTLGGSIADRRLGWLGVLNPGLSYSLSLLGLASITASLSVLLWAVEPLLILALASWLLGERVGRRLVALSGLAVLGMLLVIYDPGSAGHLLGVLLTLAGVACCAVYTVATRRLVGLADSTLGVVATQQVYALGFAGIVLGGLALAGHVSWPGGVTPEAWISALVSGLLYYATAYWLYLTGLRGVPASFAAVSFYLIPVFGIGAAYVLLGERLNPAQWIGAVVVLVAVLGIVRRPGVVVRAQP
jgi:drug/metabolite transporter (DMT)-like permease